MYVDSCGSAVSLYKGEEKEVNWGKQNTRRGRKRYYKTKWSRRKGRIQIRRTRRRQRLRIGIR
jgi:hypothetical protein